MLTGFTIPVLFGNIVGGTALFALIAYAQVVEEVLGPPRAAPQRRRHCRGSIAPVTSRHVSLPRRYGAQQPESRVADIEPSRRGVPVAETGCDFGPFDRETGSLRASFGDELGCGNFDDLGVIHSRELVRGQQGSRRGCRAGHHLSLRYHATAQMSKKR